MRKRLFIISLPVFLSVAIFFLYKWRHPKEPKDEILFYNYSRICRLSEKENYRGEESSRYIAYYILNYYKKLNKKFYINDYGRNYLWEAGYEEGEVMSYNFKEIKGNQNTEIKDMLENFSGDQKHTLDWSGMSKKTGDQNINYYSCTIRDLKVQFIMRVHTDSIPGSIKHLHEE